jgi:hypothetical protein
MRQIRNLLKFLFKSLKVKPKHRWEGNIKLLLKKIGWECSDCIQVAENWTGSFEHCNEPLVSVKLRGLFD